MIRHLRLLRHQQLLHNYPLFFVCIDSLSMFLLFIVCCFDANETKQKNCINFVLNFFYDVLKMTNVKMSLKKGEMSNYMVQNNNKRKVFF
jgi:hypothetical protein